MRTAILENNKSTSLINELERGIFSALETYSNVHRGSGHYSMVTTKLFEQARDIVLETMGLSKSRYVVVFCSSARADELILNLSAGSFQCLSSYDVGLPIGIRALAIDKRTLPKGPPFQSGGGATAYVMRDGVVWAGAPDKFEAGTPAIINVIAFAKAHLLIKKYGKDVFSETMNANHKDNNDLHATDIPVTVDFLYHDELEQFTGRQLLYKLQQDLIGRDKTAPTMFGEVPFINLDNAASTPTFKQVLDVFFKTLYQSEEIQNKVVNEVRTICADFMGAPLSDYEVIFTSNTTESINLVANSFKDEKENIDKQVIINTLLEHNSNELPWRFIPNHSLLRISVDTNGFIDLQELSSVLHAYNREGSFGNKRIRLVTVSGASNVLGVFNDLHEVSRIVHEYGAHLMVDAAQLIAHRSVDMHECGIDYLVFSAHKSYAPFGTGVLAVRKGLMDTMNEKMELIKQSGEENSAGIAALGKALLLLKRIGMDVIKEEEQALTRHALIGLAKIPGILLYGITDTDSPEFKYKGGVIPFGIKGSLLGKLASELTIRRGIGVRYGCHCSHLLVKHMLNIPRFAERIQSVMLTIIPGFNLPGVMRISFGIENDKEDIDTFLKVLNDIQSKVPIINPAKSKQETEKQIKEYSDAVLSRVFSS